MLPPTHSTGQTGLETCQFCMSQDARMLACVPPASLRLSVATSPDRRTRRSGWIHQENRRCLRGGFPFSKPPYAALWKSSICRIQLVSGFHLGKIWATNSLATLGRWRTLTVFRHAADRFALRQRARPGQPVGASVGWRTLAVLRQVGFALRARLIGDVSPTVMPLLPWVRARGCRQGSPPSRAAVP